MPVGDRLPGAYRDWRVVEGDLHDIARRMREYDPEARLVRQDGSGRLGICIHHSRRGYSPVREMFDPSTGQPLAGCPDGRALMCQRDYDSRRFTSREHWRRFYRGLDDWEHRQRAQEEKACFDAAGDPAENMAFRMAKDAGATNRAYVSKDITPRKEAA